MSALHVVVRPRPQGPPGTPLSSLYGLFDVVVDGVNLTARIGEGEALALLGELGHAVASLATGRHARATLNLYADVEAWELGLERVGEQVLLSVFRSGPVAEVAVFERKVSLQALIDGTRRALAELEPPARAPTPVAALVRSARAALERGTPPTRALATPRAPARVQLKTQDGLGLAMAAAFRTGRADQRGASVERADLHALLGLGQLEVSKNGKTARLSDVHLFLIAERLVQIADDLLEAWRSGRALMRRFEVGGARFGLRRGPSDSPVALTLSASQQGPDAPSITFPELKAPALVDGVTRLVRALASAYIEHDPSQRQNLRLLALSSAAASLAERLDDALCDDSLTNPEPESYASFGSRRATRHSVGMWEHGGKMRFMPRWVATVPGIDLRATFLCGDRVVVGAARETACIDRATGEMLWRQPTQRAAAVVTPAGLARLHPDGRVDLVSLDDGEVRFRKQLAPRVPSGASGAVVHTPGLPKLLVVAEGERQITALDLVSGEVRWRHTARRPGAYRMRRAGKLLLTGGGDSSLFALDVTTGDVVWRARDRMPFHADVTIDKDTAFAMSAAASGPCRLHCIDPWTGSELWRADIPEHKARGQAPLVTQEVVIVPTRDKRGVGARAFHRDTGEPLWEQAPGLASATTAWLAVDDAVLINSDAGTFICLDAATGVVRYSHVFSRSVDADQPRRLEPVLRSGALFVPQHEIHVVRPKDGEVIGCVPTDLIPDLLRVDERCDVYVAEESGHLAAFGAAPRLSVVGRR
ncbi:MAG: PQQ-binding-like beta-propeller repeat protein [Polyangiaceae bacterium]|nr:PQQ-binding-like beta-propeller repeat protein [Polyangiaceae bacterium]MCW5791203.1 PQQ-binding-like beta-propeller repeat protein [Polyangiaceae bacterium]